MNDNDFDQLIRDNPDLFQKSNEVYFGVGSGWYNILRALCSLISYDVNQARFKLKHAIDNPNDKWARPIAELEASLAKAIEELPVIDQVKEKFGTLRFYVSGGKPELEHYIAFAEMMTSITCEECGAPGETRNDGWVKVLCDKHHKESIAKYKHVDRVTPSTPTFSDDE